MEGKETSEICSKKVVAVTYRDLWSLPVTTVLVSCVGNSGIPNIITIAACGIASSSPPLISLAIGVNQYSLGLIKETRDFVVNVPLDTQAYAADFCGSVSGRHIDKFAQAKLTPGRSLKVKSPYINECPVNYECVLWKVVDCGSHELILGEIQLVHIEKNVLHVSGHGIDTEKFSPLLSFQQEYWSLNRKKGVWHDVQMKK